MKAKNRKYGSLLFYVICLFLYTNFKKKKVSYNSTK